MGAGAFVLCGLREITRLALETIDKWRAAIRIFPKRRCS